MCLEAFSWLWSPRGRREKPTMIWPIPSRQERNVFFHHKQKHCHKQIHGLLASPLKKPGLWAMHTSELIKNCRCSLDLKAPAIQLYRRQSQKLRERKYCAFFRPQSCGLY